MWYICPLLRLGRARPGRLEDEWADVLELRVGQERGVLVAVEQGRVVQRLNLGLAPGRGGQGGERLRQLPGRMTDRDWEQERETSKTPNSNMWLSLYTVYTISITMTS